MPDPGLLKGKVLEVIRHASLSRLKIHTDCAEIALREFEANFTPGRILANNMVFILVSGDVLRITFKVHFNMRDAKHLAFRIFRGNSPEEIQERQAVDYFKEYGNLVAGNIATHFDNAGVELGISLPLRTRGFYEIFSDYAEKRLPVVTCSDFWKFEVGGHPVFCSAFIEIKDMTQLEKLADFRPESEAGDDGEMDFL